MARVFGLTFEASEAKISELTVAEIKAELTKRGAEFDKTAKKAELLELLDAPAAEAEPELEEPEAEEPEAELDPDAE